MHIWLNERLRGNLDKVLGVRRQFDLVAVVRPRPEPHLTSLFVERKIVDVDGT